MKVTVLVGVSVASGVIVAFILGFVIGRRAARPDTRTLVLKDDRYLFEDAGGRLK